MKRTINFSAIVALIFLLPHFLIAQQVKPRYALYDEFNHPRQTPSLHKTTAVTLSLDSVYINEFANGAKEKYRKSVFIYDQATSNCIEEYDFEWNGFSWYRAFKYTYAYDANANLTEQVHYDWNGLIWQPGWKNVFIYNSNDERTEEVNYNWVGGAWQPLMRYTYTFGTNSRLEEKNRFYWNGGSWDQIQKEEYTYDSFDMLLEKLLSSWAGTTWYPNQKSIYSYNGLGRLSIQLNYQWNGVTWEKQDSSAFSYDSNGFLNKKVDAYWNGTSWNIDDRITNTNDAHGNVLEEIYEYWGTSNSWEPLLKTESQYDLAYDHSNIAQPQLFYEVCYNKLDYFASYSWNISAWEKEADYEFFYSNFIDLEEMTLTTYSAYPIPVTNKLVIRAGEKGSATLIDITGKDLANWNLEHGEQSFDFSAYPPGLYFVHVQGRAMIKVVKQ